jgi:hypothetical protein
MGGASAPDDLDQGRRTQVWLAASDDDGARVTGQYFYHMRPQAPNSCAYDVDLQNQLLEACCKLSGVAPPT